MTCLRSYRVCYVCVVWVVFCVFVVCFRFNIHCWFSVMCLISFLFVIFSCVLHGFIFRVRLTHTKHCIPITLTQQTRQEHTQVTHEKNTENDVVCCYAFAGFLDFVFDFFSCSILRLTSYEGNLMSH